MRVYRLSAEAANQVAVLGAREVEERADFWVVRSEHSGSIQGAS